MERKKRSVLHDILTSSWTYFRCIWIASLIIIIVFLVILLSLGFPKLFKQFLGLLASLVEYLAQPFLRIRFGVCNCPVGGSHFALDAFLESPR
jgi:hypothetical protein